MKQQSVVENLLVIQPQPRTIITFNCPVCGTNRWTRKEDHYAACENFHWFHVDLYMSDVDSMNLRFKLIRGE
jgi:hypothetical protein